MLASDPEQNNSPTVVEASPQVETQSKRVIEYNKVHHSD